MDKFLQYAKVAFYNQWHLLALGSLTMLSLIGPATLATLAMVAAGEILFMSMICTNPRFQRSVDAKIGDTEEQKKIKESQDRFERLYFGLDPESRRTFDELRERCEIISKNMAQDHPTMDKISDWQSQGINKLLWVYLKLVNTRVSLTKFLKTMDDKQFDRMERDAKKKLETLGTDPAKEKMRRSIEDTLKTLAARRANLIKAQDNYDFIGLEMDRITAKLTALSELSINRQDPSAISNEVDQVAGSVESTEQAIGELNQFAGISVDDDRAPDIVSRKEERRIRI